MLSQLHGTVDTLTGDSFPSLAQALQIKDSIDTAMRNSRAVGMAANRGQSEHFLALARAARQDGGCPPAAPFPRA